MAKRSDEMKLTAPRISEDSLKSLEKIEGQEAEKRAVRMPALREVARLFNPLMTGWDTGEDEKNPIPSMKDLMENRGWKDSVRMGDGIQAYGFSRQNPWVRIAMEDEDLMEESDVADWCQNAELHCSRQFGRSNFYDEGRAAVRSCGDFGTAIMVRNRNKERNYPSYRNLHIGRSLIMEDENGEVDVLFYELWLSAFDAVRMFGEASLPATIQEAYRNNLTRKWQFYHLIFPLDKFDLDLGRRSIRGMPIYSLYVSTSPKWKAVREGGYEVPNFWAWRWSRASDGSAWGTDAPGLLSVSDVRQANGMRKEFNRQILLKGRPPIKATEGIANRLNLTPNGVTTIRPGQDYTAGLVIGDPVPILDMIKYIGEDVDDTYHTKLFLVLSQTMDQQRTLGEAGMIKGEQAAMLTAFMGRMSMEFLERAHEDMVQSELEAGRMPPPPAVLQGKRIRTDLVSPLALLMKRYMLLDPTRQWLSEVITIGKNLDPTIVDVANVERYVRNAAELYHVDRRVVRDVVEVEKRRRIRAEQQQAILQAQLAAQKAEAGAKAYAAGSRAPEAGSPMAAAMGPAA